MSKIKINYGKANTEYGPGVLIEIDHDQLAMAIDHWLHSKGFVIHGPRTIRVMDDGEGARIFVDPEGFVIHGRRKFSGRGPGGVSRDHEECGVPSLTLGACDLPAGHEGNRHASYADGFYARCAVCRKHLVSGEWGPAPPGALGYACPTCSP